MDWQAGHQVAGGAAGGSLASAIALAIWKFGHAPQAAIGGAAPFLYADTCSASVVRPEEGDASLRQIAAAVSAGYLLGVASGPLVDLVALLRRAWAEWLSTTRRGYPVPLRA